MSRRVRVPATDDLFRPTAVPDAGDVGAPGSEEGGGAPPGADAAPGAAVVELPTPPRRQASGRVRHDEKMTVYVTSEELLDLEHARLELRRHHGLAVDRGRLVRAAVALALAELDEHGADSALLRRLSAGS